MTLLNTVANFGGTWPGFFALSLVDALTIKSCSSTPLPDTQGPLPSSCSIERDGFYLVSFGAVSIGLLLSYGFLRVLRALESVPSKDWRISNDSDREMSSSSKGDGNSSTVEDVKIFEKEEEEEEMETEEIFLLSKQLCNDSVSDHDD